MRQARLTIGLCAALFCLTAAAEVLVVTDRHHPVQVPADVRVAAVIALVALEASQLQRWA
jgi:hypothetical protein